MVLFVRCIWCNPSPWGLANLKFVGEQCVGGGQSVTEAVCVWKVIRGREMECAEAHG